jgi:hypothetical protein
MPRPAIAAGDGCLHRHIRQGSRAKSIAVGRAKARSEDHASVAGRLPDIDAAAADSEIGADQWSDRFGDAHVWRHHLFANNIPKPFGDAGAPCSRRVDKAAGVDWSIFSSGEKLKAVPIGNRELDTALLAYDSALLTCATGKGWSDKPRIGLAVLRTEGATCKVLSKIRITPAQIRTIENLE